jgi:hypothetical protein
MSVTVIAGKGQEKGLVEILAMRCENVKKLRDKGELE